MERGYKFEIQLKIKKRNKKVKQIQRLIEGLLHKETIGEFKARKVASTQYYLEQRRRAQYMGATPEGFRARSGADYFVQR